jgi:2'-5' RNA ligase
MLDRWALEVALLEHELAIRRASRRRAPAHFREADVKPTSTMVALYPPPALARDLAVTGGEAPELLHVTLVYLGDTTPAEVIRTNDVVSRVAAGAPKLTGEISGKGTFTAGPKPVTYLSVDLPDLPQVRQDLVDALEAEGLPVNREHGFTPHMTIAYAARNITGNARPVTFGALHVVRGNHHEGIHRLGPLDLTP